MNISRAVLRASTRSTHCQRRSNRLPSQVLISFKSQPTSPFRVASHSHSFSTSITRYSESPGSSSSQPPPKAPRPPTDFGHLNVLGDAPPLAFAVDSCHPDGFVLNNGMVVENTSILLLGGEVFQWSQFTKKKMPLNIVGQFELPTESLGILELVWPKPDLFIIGTGDKTYILSPNTRKWLSSLGIRVEFSDTRNAAAQYNLLATERGINEVGALLMPAGWRPTL